MDAYDELPPRLRAAIRESLHDVWDTWEAVNALRRGVTEDVLIRMVRAAELNCHREASADGAVPPVPSLNFKL